MGSMQPITLFDLAIIRGIYIEGEGLYIRLFTSPH